MQRVETWDLVRDLLTANHVPIMKINPRGVVTFNNLTPVALENGVQVRGRIANADAGYFYMELTRIPDSETGLKVVFSLEAATPEELRQIQLREAFYDYGDKGVRIIDRVRNIKLDLTNIFVYPMLSHTQKIDESVFVRLNFETGRLRFARQQAFPPRTPIIGAGFSKYTH